MEDFEKVNSVIRGMESVLPEDKSFFWMINEEDLALFWNGKEILFFKNGETNSGKSLSRQRWGIRNHIYKHHLEKFYLLIEEKFSIVKE